MALRRLALFAGAVFEEGEFLAEDEKAENSEISIFGGAE